MTRRIEAEGDTLEAALVQALADLAGCDAEKVRLELDAPGLEGGLATQVTLVVDAHDTDGASEDREEPAESRPAKRERAPKRAPAADAEAEDEDDDRSGRGASRSEPLDDDVDLDAEADAAADFVEGLLDVMDLPGDLKIRVLDDHAEVEIVEVGSGALIGRRGQTLEAIQELLRCAIQREFQRRSHVQIDVEGYRARRLEKLLEKAEEAIEDVLNSGEPERLEPMDVFERKAVHHLVAEHDGVMSRSQGREPARRVVIEPA